MALASLVCSRLGLSKEAVRAANSKVQIVSVDWYYHPVPVLAPLFGAGQGSRSSSAIWQAVSTLIFRMMPLHSKGVAFTDPLQLPYGL
jgi:hypothetical protein